MENERSVWPYVAAGLGTAVACFLVMQIGFSIAEGSGGWLYMTMQVLGWLLFVVMLLGLGVAAFSPLLVKRRDNAASVPEHAVDDDPINPVMNSLAIVSFVLAFIFPLLGVIFGHVARSQIRRTREQGGGLALAGLIIGYVSLALGAIALVVVLGQNV